MAVIIFPFLLTVLTLNLLIVTLPGNYTRQIGPASLMCSEELGELGSDLSISDFTSTLHNIASTTIPRNKCKPKKHNTPWFNDECRSAILERKKAPRKVKTFPTAANLEQFKIYRAKARRTIRTARQHSWQTFVSKINSRTPIKKVWKMINKIAGKNNQTVYIISQSMVKILPVSQTLQMHSQKNSLTTHRLITTVINSVHIRIKLKPAL